MATTTTTNLDCDPVAASSSASDATARRGGYARIGHGVHSEVFHRPGSRWVVQVFHPHTLLTPQRLTREFDHLRAEYTAMPELIGRQRLFSARVDDHPAESRHQMLVVKRFVDVDPAISLLRVQPWQVSEAQRLQLAHFVTITRSLLALPLAGDVPDTGVPRLPDIIDDEFRNLAFDRVGTLRLLDTNELISTAHLYDLLGTSATLDLAGRRIHAKFFARLLLLETLTGRGRQELTADPLYRGFLAAEQIDILLHSAPDPVGPGEG